jgi:hypothetical protein
MVKTASIFSQLLRFFPHTEFSKIVSDNKAERHAKGFTCWAQFVSMLFCQLAGADSLREICTGLACCLGKLRHLGLKEAPNKSTLSYANAHRPAAMFECPVPLRSPRKIPGKNTDKRVETRSEAVSHSSLVNTG